MNIGGFGTAWIAATFWLVGGVLLLVAGSGSGVFALGGIASIVMGLVVAVLPVRPVVALSVGLSVAFTLVAVGLTALDAIRAVARGRGLLCRGGLFLEQRVPASAVGWLVAGRGRQWYGAGRSRIALWLRLGRLASLSAVGRVITGVDRSTMANPSRGGDAKPRASRR